MIRAVLFDLDDTLFEQLDWLTGAWLAVAIRARPHGVDIARFYRALRDVAAEGSDRGRIIDRALVTVGASNLPVEPFVDAFRSYRAARLTPYPGVAAALADLRRVVPVGLVTDGDPAIQRAKLGALRLADAFDAVVLSDELGREHRKPAPTPFLTAADRLGVTPDTVVYVGDRPDKDVAGAQAVGMRAVRVRTGEYACAPDVVAAWRNAPDAATAAGMLQAILEPSPAWRSTPVGAHR